MESQDERSEPVAREQKILALHRYFIYADRMRVHFSEESDALAAQRSEKEARGETLDMTELFVPLMYMSLWYGLLYVVAEGWQALKLDDPTIDGCLAQENLKLLARYRNGTFHYKPRYWDERFVNFFSAQDSVPWVRGLHEAFNQWFLRWLRERKSRSEQA
jgi:hypothetical protein